jgi:hypothetical protein
MVFRATVRNQGSAATPDTLGVGFSVSGGGNYTWASYGSPLGAGGALVLTASGGADGTSQWLATPGPHTVTANADDIDRFLESLEDNNTLSTSFNVWTPHYAVNSGGAAAGAFEADNYVTGGSTYSVAEVIDTAAVSNPAPQAVYQSERWNNFTYTFPNLVPDGTYAVRLHFAEIYYDAPGSRRFDVLLNGSPVLTNFDVFAEAGGKFRALVKQFSIVADTTGTITVQFSKGTADWPKCSGVELAFVGLIVPPPRFTSITQTNGNITMVWQSYPGKSYRVQYKQDLPSGNWLYLSSELLASTNSLSFTTPIGTNTRRFYRVHQLN